jgi:hypothetical protein
MKQQKTKAIGCTVSLKIEQKRLKRTPKDVRNVLEVEKE